MATRSKTSPMDNSECGVFNRIEQDAKNSVLQSTRAPSPSANVLPSRTLPVTRRGMFRQLLPGGHFDAMTSVLRCCAVGCYRLDEWLHAMCFVGFFF